MIINPVLGLLSIIAFLGIILLLVGIEQVVVGIFYKGRSRFSSIGLGIIVIILSVLVLAFPAETSIFVMFLLGFALMLDGASRIVKGINNRHEEKSWSRAFSIGTGALSIVLAVMILVFPLIGIIFVGLLIGIAALIIGIQIISEGVRGRIRVKDTSI